MYWFHTLIPLCVNPDDPTRCLRVNTGKTDFVFCAFASDFEKLCKLILCQSEQESGDHVSPFMY